MIFISAQPDQFYFVWQLELLIYNLNKLGVDKNNIHVLFGFGEAHGVNHKVKEFISDNSDMANFFIYSDTRIGKKYAPSLRPHIIAKHLHAFPHLEKSVLFYHDSDLIFRELPDVSFLESGKTWYVADTRSYLGHKYLQSCLKESDIRMMCNVIGIEQDIIIKNDIDAGGAQYVLKNTTAKFWEKIELDCEKLYHFLTSINIKKNKAIYKNGKKSRFIQSWCADMWAILWNGWKMNEKVRIHSDLNFCWPNDNIEKWQEKKILHYAGDIKKEELQFFRKTNFLEYSPFFDNDLAKISRENCSFPLVKMILDYRIAKLSAGLIDLLDTIFVIIIHDDEESDIVSMFIGWIGKYFKTTITVLEFGSNPKWKKEKSFQKHLYKFYYTDENFSDSNKNDIIIEYIQNLDQDNIILFKKIYFTSPLFLLKCIKQLRMHKTKIIFANLKIFIVDSLFSEIFSRNLDHDIFLMNIKKFIINKNFSNDYIFMFNKKYNDIFNLAQKNEEKEINSDAFMLT